MKIHQFSSTGEAYDACQCDPNIASGDVLLVPEEKVVGLAWTWPVAISFDNGALHRALLPQDGFDRERLMRDAGWTLDHLRAAIKVAQDNDIWILPQWCVDDTHPDDEPAEFSNYQE